MYFDTYKKFYYNLFIKFNNSNTNNSGNDNEEKQIIFWRVREREHARKIDFNNFIPER